MLRHAGERFRSATSGVVRAPVQYGAVWQVGSGGIRINVTDRDEPRAWPLTISLLVHFHRVLKSFSDFVTCVKRQKEKETRISRLVVPWDNYVAIVREQQA